MNIQWPLLLQWPVVVVVVWGIRVTSPLLPCGSKHFQHILVRALIGAAIRTAYEELNTEHVQLRRYSQYIVPILLGNAVMIGLIVLLQLAQRAFMMRRCERLAMRRLGGRARAESWPMRKC
eukprot:6209412-Pleurochrysis_carterae.AAC.1